MERQGNVQQQRAAAMDGRNLRGADGSACSDDKNDPPSSLQPDCSPVVPQKKNRKKKRGKSGVGHESNPALSVEDLFVTVSTIKVRRRLKCTPSPEDPHHFLHRWVFADYQTGKGFSGRHVTLGRRPMGEVC